MPPTSCLPRDSVPLNIDAADADGYTALHYAQSTSLDDVASVRSSPRRFKPAP